AVLFWTKQANRDGNVSLELRATQCKDVVPRYLLTNKQMLRLADYMVNKRRSYWLYPVHMLFSPYQAMMLNRYGLNYCCGYYLEEPKRQVASSSLLDLIPHRVEDEGLMKVSNPLASSLVIADKQARRLFQAIDGHMTVRELMLVAQLDREEISAALRLLLAKH